MAQDASPSPAPGGRRQWPQPVAVAAFSAFAAYLVAELLLVSGQGGVIHISSGLVFVAFCLAPMAGLVLLVFLSSGRLRILLAALVVLGTAAGAAMDFYALHLAPPDAQNAIVVAVVAFWQMVVFLVAGMAALTLHLLRRRRRGRESGSAA